MGSPWELIEKEGLFWEMVNHTGKNAENVRKVAKDSEDRKKLNARIKLPIKNTIQLLYE